jgi:hypothetical protein
MDWSPISDKEETKAPKNGLKWEDLGRDQKTNFWFKKLNRNAQIFATVLNRLIEDGQMRSA